jgi:hypothetical protein
MAKKKSAKATASEKDKSVKAKPTGYRFKTDHLKKKDGTLTKKGKKLYFKRPTKKEVEMYGKEADGSYPSESKQIYHETRKTKDHSDDNLKKKYEDGGAAVIEMSIEDMKNSLGRDPKYPYDFIAGKKYVKCFLRPYYRLED